MSRPTRNLVFFRACGLGLICAAVFAVSYPLLDLILN